MPQRPLVDEASRTAVNMADSRPDTTTACRSTKPRSYLECRRSLTQWRTHVPNVTRTWKDVDGHHVPFFVIGRIVAIFA